MDKVFASPAAAIADIPEGATVGLGGFGQQHCFATSLLLALRDKGTKNLCVVCNSLGGNGELRGQILAESGQVSRLMASFTARPGTPTAAEDQILAGTLKAELVPQGILVERCRAGGAGIPAFYSPVGVDTAIEAGKEIRYFGGKRYVMEEAITLDYALLRAYRADRAGNVQMRGGSRSLNVAFAKSARIAIVEVDEIVETGEIPPEQIGLPGIFVSRVVKSTHQHDVQSLSPAPRRPNDKPRLYKGRPGLTREAMARRAASIVKEGSYVNLGIGIPTLVSNYLEGRDVLLHAENGILGYGRLVTGDDIDPDIYNAGGQFVATVQGASYFDSVTSFEMARGGHLSTVILGSYEVDAEANIANWSTAETVNSVGSIGGAMDLVAGGCELIVIMEHVDSRNRPKLRNRCSYPLTGTRCVNWIVTDLAMLRWDGAHFVLEEVMEGFSAEEVIAMGDMDVKISPALKTLS